MNRTVRNGLILTLLHVVLVASLPAKMAFDRSRYPRVWARTLPVDPDLPIRGRYVSLRVEAGVPEEPGVPNIDELEAAAPRAGVTTRPVRLSAEAGSLVARGTDEGVNRIYARIRFRDGRRVAELMTPVAFFIPENVPDPSIRQPGEELWVEITLPRVGPPRPIQLGVMKDGHLTPLNLR